MAISHSKKETENWKDTFTYMFFYLLVDLFLIGGVCLYLIDLQAFLVSSYFALAFIGLVAFMRQLRKK